MNRAVRLILIIGVLLVAGGEGAAQPITSPYRFVDTSQYVGVFGGYVNTSSGRLELGPESAPTFGARWALRISGPITVGAEVSYMPSKRTVRDTVFVTQDSLFRPVGEVDMNLLTAMANVRFNITGPRTWRNLQPFALFGAGAAIDLSGDDEIETDLPANARFGFGTTFAGQFGAGIEWFATPGFSARVDARSLFWKLSVPEAFLLTSHANTLPRSEWEQNIKLSAGLSIHF